eukprot:TRINITY_DN779_c0_g1_i1.p1 TRINITY_DN779_c0_g1~~TRINITY_DN779_c0_g1_i1.p1  ORF type:complete len:264 (-),score=3.25 TRINITY_DN779_c0_g1_i1:61-852(-)
MVKKGIRWDLLTSYYATNGILAVNYQIRDMDFQDMTKKALQVSEVLHYLLQNKKVVYVHCSAGLYRAPQTVMAYLCFFKKYELEDARRLIKNKRPVCEPNFACIKAALKQLDKPKGSSKNLYNKSVQEETFERSTKSSGQSFLAILHYLNKKRKSLFLLVLNRRNTLAWLRLFKYHYSIQYAQRADILMICLCLSITKYHISMLYVCIQCFCLAPRIHISRTYLHILANVGSVCSVVFTLHSIPICVYSAVGQEFLCLSLIHI